MKLLIPLKSGDVLDVSELSEKVARRIVSFHWHTTGQDISHRGRDLCEEACGGMAIAIASREADTKAIARAGFREAQKLLRQGSRESVSLTAYSDTVHTREIIAESELWGATAVRLERGRIAARARQLIRAARRARAEAKSNKGGRADMALRSDLRIIRRATQYIVHGQLTGDTFSFREATAHKTPEKSRLAALYKVHARFKARVLDRLQT